MKLTAAQRLAIRLAAAVGVSKGINLPEHLQPKKKRKPPTPLPDYCQLQPGPPGRWEVTIREFQPVMLNVIKAVHWAKEGRMKRGDAEVIGQSLREAGVSRAKGKRRVQFILVMGKGQRSPDGDAPFKSGLDALTRCGALVDDNSKWAEVMPTAFERSKVMATRILVEDLT